MANTLGVYNPIFYAQEALIHLENALGMATRVHRGYDSERSSAEKGSVVSIRRPSTFTAENAPDDGGQNLTSETVSITLDQWKEVKFVLTDKELAYSERRIIADHIEPAAYALANNIDAALCGLYTQIGNTYAAPGSNVLLIADIIGPRKVLFNTGVPVTDPSKMHMMVDGTGEASLLAQSAFTQWSGSGATGVNAQLSGFLGTRFGVGIFANQNVKTHSKGTSADPVGAIDSGNGGYSKGDAMIHVDAVGEGETWNAGDTLIIAGDTTEYAVAADADFTGTETDVYISPPLQADAAEDAVVTCTLEPNFAQQMMFHTNAFALVMAPLQQDLANAMGARVATVTDPITGLSIRSRMYYVGNDSAVHVALDVLYGVKAIDPRLAVRIIPAS